VGVGSGPKPQTPNPQSPLLLLLYMTLICLKKLKYIFII
jgi:hypothetical protein